MYETKPPADGSPWIVPVDEAKGPWVHTEHGIAALMDLVPKKWLRPDQLIPRPWVKR